MKEPEITTDEMRAAQHFARIQAYDAKRRGDLKQESDWIETSKYWRERIAATTPMGY